MELFDGRVNLWTKESGCIISNRLELYNKIKREFENENISKCDINITKRIGMESTMAEVFKVNVKNYFVAGKILPIFKDSSFKDNENEIRLALEASQLVLDGKSEYFPLVYDFNTEYPILCQETYFYGSDNYKLNFYEKSKRYQQYKILLDSVDNTKIKEKIVNFKKRFVDAEVVYEEFIDKIGEIILPQKINSHILFSEVACSDLNYYLEHNYLDENEYYVLLKHIFYAIQDLHTKLNIFHTDLHLGNILVINSDKFNIIPLIHDFGKSRKSKFENLYEKQHDIFYFIGQLQYNFDIPEKIKKYLDDITNILDDSVEKYPIIDVVKYWENLE